MSNTRSILLVTVLATVMLVLTLYGGLSEPDVYACNDVQTNPPDVVKHCKHLTKYQWWGTYYQGVRK